MKHIGSILSSSRHDVRQQVNQIDGLIVMEGGVRNVAGGYDLGVVGVRRGPVETKMTPLHKRRWKRRASALSSRLSSACCRLWAARQTRVGHRIAPTARLH